MKTKKINITKKILSIIMIIIMFLGIVQPVFALSPSGSGQWVAGQWDSQIYTTKMNEGVFLRRLVNYTTGEKYTTFCAEFLVESPVGAIETATTVRPTGKNLIKACKAAYIGWYSKYGDYVIDGGIMNNTGKVMDYVFTQQYIWEILEQEPGTFRDSNIQSQYETYKENINNEIANMEKKPSFDAVEIEVEAGKTTTLTDTNKVLADYASIDKTVDGIRFVHNKGENTMSITVDENCNAETYRVSEATMKSWGMIKEGTEDKDTTVYFTFREGVQDQLYTMNYNDPITMSLNLKINSKGNLELAKKDSKGNYVPNTSFKLSYNADMSDDIGTYTTGSNGKVTVEDLKLGTIYIQETKVPEHLILDTTIKSATVKSGQTVSYEATNKWKQGYIKVVKKDAESDKVVKQAGTVFDIYNSDNEKITSITTNSEGIATSGLLDYGTYYVKESKAPNKYTIKVEVSENIEVIENSKTYEITVLNTRVKGSITISKEDTKTGKQAQGDATLKGALYGLYARTPILDPADNSVIYNTDEKVGEMVTNAEAKATINNLYLGQYYIKEITPSKGYTLDTTKYNVDLDYENQNVSVITKNVTVKERVISQPFQIIKVSSDEAGEADLLEGAEFTIKLQTDIKKYGSWEEAPIAKNANGETAAIMVTDSKGYALSDRLPYGTYIVRETKVPDDKHKVEDFKVVISKDSSEPQVWRVFNDTSFTSVLAIVKKDAESGKVVEIEGATFKIKNLDTNEYFGYWEWNPLPHYVAYWTTDETGTVMTGDILKVGNYQLEEIKSPKGYLISSTPVKFRISSNTAYETLPDGKTPVITVTQTDTHVKGKVNVEKRGEVLVEFKDGKFIYEEKGLANAKYEVFAREDILDPADGSVIHKKGTVVDTITTNSEGKATSKALYLGEYSVREIKAPDGFVLSDKVENVSLKYKDQNTAIVFDNASFINERQKVDVTVIKKDAETDTSLLGAEFGLYAKNDIVNYKGDVVAKAGELIETATSNIEGKVDFTSDLPLTNFEIKEHKAPIGYASSDEVINVDATYKGQDVKFIELEYEFKNKRIEVEMIFSKVDETGSKELPGATIQIIDKETNEIVEEWVSTEEPHIIKYLVEGKEYIMKEVTSPYGYEIAEEITFVAGDGEKITMKNMPILKSVRVEKLDKDTKEHIKSNKFVFGIYEDKECTKLIKKAGANEYEGTALFDDLRYGTYYIKEIQAPLGYKLSDQVVKIEINDEGVFADGESLEEKDNVYSFEYYNSLIPKIQTGNETNYIILSGLAAISLIGIIRGIIVLRKKHNEK